MAIRPTDLTLSIANQVQQQPISQRAEENPRINQTLAQAQFAAQAEQRNESIAESKNLSGNRVEVERREREQQEQGRRRRRKPGEPEAEPEAVAPALDTTGERHLIDFSA